ncbi:MAG TPA: hypothetical protein VGC85_03505 [Chthoniobacterales bacterium]
MNPRPLVFITTRLPPAICGIGSYSWLLREHWPNESRPVHFLTVDPGTSPRGDRVTAFANRGDDLADALQAIGSADVLLHYAGRAYQRFGVPLSLARSLEHWKREHRDARLTIFVHELPATFSITSRHYWLGVMSKQVIRRLARSADVLITNTEHHRETLKKISGRDDVHVFPIASNIEPPNESDPPRGCGEFVVFGLPFGREQTVGLFGPSIDRWHAAGRLTKLHVIGPAPATPRNSSFVLEHGALTPPEVSKILQRAEFGLTNANETTWSKSGSFMALAAHGCLPVIAGARVTAPLVHAVAANELEAISDAEVETRRRELRRWYRENADWQVIAPRIARLVSPL